MRNTDIVILKALLSANDAFVSGNQLANRLGISRVGVWARLEKLRDHDFDFEAVRHRGYRLLQEPAYLNEDLIRAYLELDEFPADIVALTDIDSTNSEAERLLAAGRPAPFAVLSSRQTAGRGRFGRKWHSPQEGNIYASFAFRPKLPPARLQRITLWFGLCICRFLNEELHIPVKIKWPNDLLLHGKKVAGMLTEARVDSDFTRDLVFGVGLNVNADTTAWPAEVASVATALSAATPARLPINKIAARLVRTVIRAYDEYVAGSIDTEFQENWPKYDLLQGLTVNASSGQQKISGIVKGIDNEGRLLVQNTQGILQSLNSGEVSLGSAAMGKLASANGATNGTR